MMANDEMIVLKYVTGERLEMGGFSGKTQFDISYK
jgi:hypothetical protein